MLCLHFCRIGVLLIEYLSSVKDLAKMLFDLKKIFFDHCHFLTENSLVFSNSEKL